MREHGKELVLALVRQPDFVLPLPCAQRRARGTDQRRSAYRPFQQG
jgi:hypothetical protein